MNLQMFSKEEQKVLKDLKAVFQDLNLPILLVGAMARLLVFDHHYTIQGGRSTIDIDIAISVENQSKYQEILSNLQTANNPLFKETKIRHRLIHIETQIPVDIVPFGKIAEPDQQVEWKGEDRKMNVAGFTEALENAQIEKIDTIEILVPTLPALLGLKLLAWGDRRERTKKDLEDINFILKNYQDDEHIYKDEELIEKLATREIEYLDAAIYLLGKEMKRIFRDETIYQINQLLNELLKDLDEDYIEPEQHRLKILYWGINFQ